MPILLFDEIGLAEISPFNPLKVLHSWLEPEIPLIGFVGISNWRLDASKMNRAIYITRPDPTCNQLEVTAEAIFKSYCRKIDNNDKVVMKTLASTYYRFREEQEQSTTPDFHGTRDFYSMVKYVSKELKELKKFDVFIHSEERI